MVTFQLFAKPVLDGLSGAKPQPLPFAKAGLKRIYDEDRAHACFLPAKLGGSHEQPEVELVHWQGSGDLMAISHSNCCIAVPPEEERFAAGDAVTVLLF